MGTWTLVLAYLAAFVLLQLAVYRYLQGRGGDDAGVTFVGPRSADGGTRGDRETDRRDPRSAGDPRTAERGDRRSAGDPAAPDDRDGRRALADTRDGPRAPADARDGGPFRRCPNCGEANDPEGPYEFCRNCASRLPG